MPLSLFPAPRRIRRLVSSLVIVAAAALAVPTFASACAGADIQPNAQNIATARSATLCLLNQQRASFAAELSAPSRPLPGVGTPPPG